VECEANLGLKQLTIRENNGYLPVMLFAVDLGDTFLFAWMVFAWGSMISDHFHAATPSNLLSLYLGFQHISYY